MKISIKPSFWFTIGLMGFLFGSTISSMILFVIVAFISVLVHELGHAFVAKLSGLTPRIELQAFGGV
ncbi:MAG TPA: hypothetical protein VN457_06750, partial [Chlamydiales bacterium]|nr:hypothetical protein [Chlamydiales bacterium]